MKKLIILIILGTTVCTYSQPKFTLQFTGGYSMPLPDLKGEFGPTLASFTENNSDSNTYFIKSGFNFGIYGKKAFGKKGNLRIVGSLIFNYFSQNKDYKQADSVVSIKYKLNILSVTLGGEWEFLTKKSKINPFIGADLMLNFFSGSQHIESDSATTDKALQSARRLGIQIGGGIDFPFTYNIGAVVGFKYTIANWIGKEEGTNVGTNYSLEDIRYGKNRNISYLQIYGGISFYFGY